MIYHLQYFHMIYWAKKKAKLTKVSVEFSMAPLKIIERWFSKDSGASMTWHIFWDWWSYITICSDALTYSSQVKLWNKHLGLGIIFQDKHTYIHTYVHICIAHTWKYICYFTKQIREFVCTLVKLLPKGRSCITSNDIAGSGGPVWQTLAQQRPRSSCTKAQLRLRRDWL